MRIVRLALFLMLAAWPAGATDALQGDLANEIVYRAGLGRADDVALLLKQGASPKQMNDEGVPVLSLAATRKDEEGLNVVKALLAAGADIDARDSQGQTPLFYAARQGNKETVLHLMEQGAGYYLTDYNGEIARTIAFRAGHRNILEAMDDFVKAQDAKVRKQYEEYNQAVTERLQEAEKPQEGETAAPPAENAENAGETVPPPQAVEVLDTKALEETSRELSFHACAFQYWSFCDAAGQTTELSSEELLEAIAFSKDKILELSRSIVDEHGAKRAHADRVVNQSKKHIFNRLSAMPSKTYRFEHGVGKMEDMNTRCRDVSLRWEQQPPPIPKPQVREQTGGGPVYHNQKSGLGKRRPRH